MSGLTGLLDYMQKTILVGNLRINYYLAISIFEKSNNGNLFTKINELDFKSYVIDEFAKVYDGVVEYAQLMFISENFLFTLIKWEIILKIGDNFYLNFEFNPNNPFYIMDPTNPIREICDN